MRKIAILIPAHNEQVVIAQTLRAALRLVSPEDLYVVSDGSRDHTKKVAQKYTKNVLELQPNQGKANALNRAIKHFRLATRYHYLMPLDADTEVSENFFEHTLPILEADRRQQIACVVGKVVGKNFSPITVYRVWEYEVAQTIHKQAQAITNTVIVCPGCSTVYRSKIFKKTQIPTGTLAEDMDLTFLIHRQKLGKIVFTSKPYVITQDPKNLKDFMRQIDRWYTGFWQCVLKHNIPWQGQRLDFEVALLALEGLYGSLVLVVLFIFIPLLIYHNRLSVLIAPFGFDFVFFILPTIALTAFHSKSVAILKYIPNLYFVRVLASLIFFKSFLKVVFGVDLLMGWNRAARYSLAKT